MRTAADLQMISDRVLGLAPPVIPMPVMRRRRGDMAFVLGMFVVSGTAVAATVILAACGYGLVGARVFCASVLLLALLMRLR